MSLQKVQIPEVPRNVDINVYRFLQALRTAVIKISSSVTQPGPVTNLTATAKAGGAIIEFTRSDADRYVLFRNTVKSFDLATQIDLGNSNRFVDDVGTGSVVMYYWIKAWKGGIEGPIVGPVTATTLDLDVTITPGSPPPGSQFPALDSETDRMEEGKPSGTDYKKV
jgi:hypothetical protein